MCCIKKTAVAAVALLAAFVAAGPTPLAAGAPGWQVDVKYGPSSLEQAFDGLRNQVFDDDSAASGVEVGYGFNKFIGVQVGYHDLGTFQGFGSFCANNDQECLSRLALYAPVPFEADLSGWSLAAVPSWPFTDRLSVFGKLGFLDWETDLVPAPELAGEIDSERFSDRDLLTAVGVRYRFGTNLAALFELQRLELDLDSATLGVSWKF